MFMMSTYFGFLPPIDDELLVFGLLVIRDGRRGGGGGGCQNEWQNVKSHLKA
jgi:hypothetical protein